jgi:hypothetical protein
MQGKKSLTQFSFILIFISFIVPLIQYHIEKVGHIGISAVFINDTKSYWENLISYHDGREGNFYTLFGVLILYYPAYYLGWFYCYLINFFLLILSCLFFLKTISLWSLKFSNDKVISTFILVIFNFYLWGILFFPNKEIPLIFLVNFLIYTLAAKKNKIIPFFVIIVVFFFRDGFAFILFCTVITIWTLRKSVIKYRAKFVLALMLFLMFFSMKNLSILGIPSKYTYVIDRNLQYESSSSFAYNLPYSISFLIKLLNNSIAQVFRAQLFDQHNRLYFHGIGLWQFAVVSSIGLISWIKIVCFTRYKEPSIIIIGFIIIISYLLLCTSSYPQARYMMPFYFWLSAAVFFYLDFRAVGIIFILTFIVAIVLIILGFSYEAGLGIDIDDFSRSIFTH